MLDQIIGTVGRGVLEQVRAQRVRVLVAGHVDEGERLGGAAQRHSQLVDGGSVLLLPQCARCACRHRPGRILELRLHPSRVRDAYRLVLEPLRVVGELEQVIISEVPSTGLGRSG